MIVVIAPDVEGKLAMSQLVLLAKEPSQLNDLDCRPQVKIFRPSMLMATSSHEGIILEWDETSQTNPKQRILNK